MEKAEIEREIANIKINLIEKNTATEFNNDDGSMFIEGMALLIETAYQLEQYAISEHVSESFLGLHSRIRR